MKNFYKHYSVFKERAASRFVLRFGSTPRQGQKDILQDTRSRVKAFRKNFFNFFCEALSEGLALC